MIISKKWGFFINVPLDYFKACLTTKKDGKKTRESAFVQNCIPVKKININLNPQKT